MIAAKTPGYDAIQLFKTCLSRILYGLIDRAIKVHQLLEKTFF